MKYIVESSKSVEQASKALEAAVVEHGFGVMHIHDLHATLNAKGVPFKDAVRVFEVCNPHKAAAVLSHAMELNMALPCRISVWEKDGQTYLGMIEPSAVLSMFSDSKALGEVAAEVGQITRAIINDAA